MFFSLLLFSLAIKNAGSRHLSIHGEIEIVLDEESPSNPSYLIEDEERSKVYMEWIQFQEKYSKQYNEMETKNRFEIFRKNYELIKNHNLKYEKGEVSYYMEINKFADLDEKEINLFYKGVLFSPPSNKVSENDNFDENIQNDLPAQVDWRTKNVVTPVKNQGLCGSCYTFSATGSLEGQYAKKYNKLISLSEQNLLDCSQTFGNYGCSGGFPFRSFEYVKHNHGIDTEEQYPYVERVQSCKYKKNPFTVTGYVNISSNETVLKQFSATVGPISVLINANNNFVHYKGGVFQDDDCHPTDLNHAVLLVGYGVEKGKDYWLVKNSWGANWGEHGYIKMTRNGGNNCGIASQANYPLV